jgi:hypothetical protein
VCLRACVAWVTCSMAVNSLHPHPTPVPHPSPTTAPASPGLRVGRPPDQHPDQPASYPPSLVTGMYVRTYVRVYVRVCVCTYVRVCCTYVCMYVCMHVYMYVCVYICIYVCLCGRFRGPPSKELLVPVHPASLRLRLHMSDKAGGEPPARVMKTCRRCKTQFNPEENTETSCRFHREWFGGEDPAGLGLHNKRFREYMHTMPKLLRPPVGITCLWPTHSAPMSPERPPLDLSVHPQERQLNAGWRQEIIRGAQRWRSFGLAVGRRTSTEISARRDPTCRTMRRVEGTQGGKDKQRHIPSALLSCFPAS